MVGTLMHNKGYATAVFFRLVLHTQAKGLACTSDLSTHLMGSEDNNWKTLLGLYQNESTGVQKLHVVACYKLDFIRESFPDIPTDTCTWMNCPDSFCSTELLTDSPVLGATPKSRFFTDRKSKQTNLNQCSRLTSIRCIICQSEDSEYVHH